MKSLSYARTRAGASIIRMVPHQPRCPTLHKYSCSVAILTKGRRDTTNHKLVLYKPCVSELFPLPLRLQKSESKTEWYPRMGPRGRLAQMVERSLSMREARGSIPRSSSLLQICPFFFFGRATVFASQAADSKSEQESFYFPSAQTPHQPTNQPTNQPFNRNHHHPSRHLQRTKRCVHRSKDFDCQFSKKFRVRSSQVGCWVALESFVETILDAPLQGFPSLSSCGCMPRNDVGSFMPPPVPPGRLYCQDRAHVNCSSKDIRCIFLWILTGSI